MRQVTPPRVNEYHVGPEAHGIRMCVECGHEIEPMQVWLKVYAPLREYAVGLHTSCIDYQAQRRGPMAAKFSECSLCGHLSQDAGEMAMHFRFVHHLGFGVRLDRLVA